MKKIAGCQWGQPARQLHRDSQPLSFLQEPFAVNGSVIITVNMTQPSPCIVLHAREMKITHLAIEEPHTHGKHLT